MKINKLLLTTTIVLAGCDVGTITNDKNTDLKRFETACVEAIKKRLKSPSSFQFIKTTDISEPIAVANEEMQALRVRLRDGREEYKRMNLKENPTLEESKALLEYARAEAKFANLYANQEDAMLFSILVEYDAQNSFGAMLRGIESCEYTSWGGSFDNRLDYDDVLIDGKTYTNWLLDQGKAFQ